MTLIYVLVYTALDTLL